MEAYKELGIGKIRSMSCDDSNIDNINENFVNNPMEESNYAVQ